MNEKIDLSDKKCKFCGKSNWPRQNLESRLCDECYIKEKHFTPDIVYPEVKKEIEIKLDLEDNNSRPDVFALMYFGEKEEELCNQLLKETDKGILVAFREFHLPKKLKELLECGTVVLKYSYYFANNKFDVTKNFEDKNKEQIVKFK